MKKITIIALMLALTGVLFTGCRNRGTAEDPFKGSTVTESTETRMTTAPTTMPTTQPTTQETTRETTVPMETGTENHTSDATDHTENGTGIIPDMGEIQDRMGRQAPHRP